MGKRKPHCIFALLAMAFILASCINSSTSFSNRSNTYQVTPELIGDQAYVADSPHSGSATVNAEKTNEIKSNTSGTGTVNDNSTNAQEGSNGNSEEEKSQPDPVAPVEDTAEDEPEAPAEAPAAVTE